MPYKIKVYTKHKGKKWRLGVARERGFHYSTLSEARQATKDYRRGFINAGKRWGIRAKIKFKIVKKKERKRRK